MKSRDLKRKCFMDITSKRMSGTRYKNGRRTGFKEKEMEIHIWEPLEEGSHINSIPQA